MLKGCAFSYIVKVIPSNQTFECIYLSSLGLVHMNTGILKEGSLQNYKWHTFSNPLVLIFQKLSYVITSHQIVQHALLSDWTGDHITVVFSSMCR